MGSPAGMTGSCFWDSPLESASGLTLWQEQGGGGPPQARLSKHLLWDLTLNARDPQSPLGSPGCGICPVSPEATSGVCHPDSDCPAWPDAVTLLKMFSIPSARVSECLPGQARGCQCAGWMF